MRGQKIGLNIGRAKIIETFWPVASAEQREGEREREKEMHSGTNRQTDKVTRTG